MKLVELTDVATNEITAINLDEVPSMKTVLGPAGTTVTQLRFRSGQQVEVYETLLEIRQLARLWQEPLSIARVH
jgi:hypothetical protein